MWDCKQPLCAAPAVYHATALYLTGTSYSTEPGEPTGTTAPTGYPTVQSSASVAERPPSTDVAAPTNVPAPTPVQSSSGGENSMAVVPLVPPSGGSNSAPNEPQQHATQPNVPEGTPIVSITSAAPPASGNSPFSAANGPPAPIAINSQLVSANSASQYLISSQTLSPGGSPITLGSGSSAQIVAIQTSNTLPVLVVGSSSSQLQLVPAATAPATLAPAPIVVDGQTVTADSASQYVIASHTLAVGEPVTLGSGSSAQAIALQTSGSQTYLVVGSSTSLVQPLASSMGIGGFVAGGFNGPSTSAPLAFTGGASHKHGRPAWALIAGGLIGVVMVML